jgi:hypothetical protein
MFLFNTPKIMPVLSLKKTPYKLIFYIISFFGDYFVLSSSGSVSNDSNVIRIRSRSGSETLPQNKMTEKN